MSLPNNDAGSGLSYFRNTATGVTQSPYFNASGALPYLGTGLNALGAFTAQSAEARSLRYNARAYQAEADIASRQGLEQEAQQRITGAKVLGRQVAAAGESGGGYGGSTGAIIGQSARNIELDALNTRYKAALQRWSFAAQSQNLAAEGRQAQMGAYLKAGAALLRGYSGNYTGASPFQYYPQG